MPSRINVNEDIFRLLKTVYYYQILTARTTKGYIRQKEKFRSEEWDSRKLLSKETGHSNKNTYLL